MKNVNYTLYHPEAYSGGRGGAMGPMEFIDFKGVSGPTVYRDSLEQKNVTSPPG